MLAVALRTLVFCFATALAADPITLSSTPPQNAPPPLPESFVSFSIEFSSFPDFAGNSSHPNGFSNILMQNLGKIQGSNPILRVGGNTQDYALYNASQSTALIGVIDLAKSADYPTTITIGPSYFESYSTWTNVTFTHGFNMAKNNSAGYDTLVATAALACKALDNGKLAYWELGNEPDLFKTSHQGPVRPPSWDEQDYVDEWLNKSRILKQAMIKACPKMVQNGKFKFIAPSFAGTTNSLAPVPTWNDGLNTDKDIALVSGHNYISGATSPGVTLQGTLMNHSSTTASVNKFLANWTQITNTSGLPFILGETNSLYNEGKPGLSNSFGATLWGVDFNLYCASKGVTRVHMHQGTNYRYAGWQPIDTDLATKGTKSPYYASVTVVSFLGDLTKHKVRVVEIPMASIYNVAYAAYVDGKLTRIAAIQLQEYNYTATDAQSRGARSSETFAFQLPSGINVKSVKVERLMANGSDAITGVTFAGLSYNYELNGGKPVVMNNVTAVETVSVGQNGLIKLAVPWSSAAIVSFL